MNIVIDSILDGKTEKEAAELAGISLYKITHWFNEGKNNSGRENISFYKRYIEAKKQSKINSIQNFYTLEAFNNKTDLTIADTLRKQQMENVLKEIGSGSSMKTAAFNSSITYETLQYWYKRGKQNFGEEYNEFYEKINILQSPIDTPKPKEKIRKTPKEIQEKETNLPKLYKHILDPLPHKINKLFRGVKESESGFAWVKKDRNSWRYERQQKDHRYSVSRENIYELYLAVKEKKYTWGVRNLEKAKETLNQSNIPLINEKFETDEKFEHILDQLPEKYSKRFRKPSSTGLSWVTKINNTWGYINPTDNVRIYDTNIYNLYLKVKDKNLPWGVRDLQKAKESLSQCEKPNITNENNEIYENIPENANITCAYFSNKDITKTIINGSINDNELIDLINYFKEFEKNIIRIITTRHSNYTELFIEFNLKKSELISFKKLINIINGTTITENKSDNNSFENKLNSNNEYTEENLLKGKSKTTIELYKNLNEKILSKYKNIEVVINKFYITFKSDNEIIASVAPFTQFLKAWINSNKIHDYKFELKDVSNIGHWGVGNYELKITSKEDISYFIELFKQSYDEKFN